jgi:hypothetical protein
MLACRVRALRGQREEARVRVLSLVEPRVEVGESPVERAAHGALLPAGHQHLRLRLRQRSERTGD